MTKKVSIHWFRKDLRLSDNPSLNYLSTKKHPVICLYIYDDINAERQLGKTSKVWLHHSLNFLNQQLQGNLLIFRGNPKKIFDDLCRSLYVENISWNRCYEIHEIKRDKLLKLFFKQKKINVNSFNGSLLWEPWEILKKDATPYKIFTPYFKKGCMRFTLPRVPETKKSNFFDHDINSLRVDDLDLLSNHKWEFEVIKNWNVGEKYAYDLMNSFFENGGIDDYKDGRNFPGKKNISKLSPYICWGQISPNVLWYKTDEYKNKISNSNLDSFRNQLGWREFSYYLLYHFPFLPKKNLRPKFDRFPWKKRDKKFIKWTKGLTGYPIIDAGMRELRKTGYMHNRVRMIVGSFLVKNLLQHWKNGEEWFWDCLFDADIANNSASWQWVAGTGTDSTPYFRIFNPITQGKKFDPNGKYTKTYVPELQDLPIKYLFNPWECPDKILKNSGITLGLNYPLPIIDLKSSRDLALSSFSSIKAG